MTAREIDELLAWCRKKLDSLRGQSRSEKYKTGYEEAMLAVMSYLHGQKQP